MRRSRETSQETNTVIQTRRDGGAETLQLVSERRISQGRSVQEGEVFMGCGSREEGQQRARAVLACPRACTEDLTDEGPGEIQVRRKTKSVCPGGSQSVSVTCSVPLSSLVRAGVGRMTALPIK